MARLNKQLITILAAYCLKAVLCHGLWCSSVPKNLVSTSQSWKSIQNPSSSRSLISFMTWFMTHLSSFYPISFMKAVHVHDSIKRFHDSTMDVLSCCNLTNENTKGMKVPNWTFRSTSARAHATQLGLTHLSHHHWCRLPLDVCCSSCSPLLSILKPVNLHQRGQGWVPVMGIRVSSWSLLQFVNFGR